MKHQIWLVCGGRKFGHVVRKFPLCSQESKETQERLKEYQFIQNALEHLACERSQYFNEDDNWLPADIQIVTGGASGADKAAVDWAIVNWGTFREYPANWSQYGRAAGPIRNKEMLEKEKPDLVIAFPGGPGTRDMVRRAKEAGIEVIEYQYDGRS